MFVAPVASDLSEIASRTRLRPIYQAEMTDPVPVDAAEQAAVEPAVDAPVEAAVDAAVASVPSPVLPDRADSPVSEVAERFLRAVIASVPLDQIEELHLFSPLRQGTLETGIAVFAARVPVAVVEPVAEEATVETDPELALEDAEEVDAVLDVAADEADEAESMADDVADEVVAEILAEEIVAEEIVTDEVIDAPTPKVRPVRHTVYTARYRYVIKGPERGKWESNIKAEAEAPLITVETVVRGVQRRAGEDSEIVRYTAAQIARALRVPYPA